MNSPTAKWDPISFDPQPINVRRDAIVVSVHEGHVAPFGLRLDDKVHLRSSSSSGSLSQTSADGYTRRNGHFVLYWVEQHSLRPPNDHG